MPLRRYMTSQKHSTWSHTGRRKVDQEVHWSVPIRLKPCIWGWRHGIVSKVFASQASGFHTQSQNSQKEAGCSSVHFSANIGERKPGARWTLMATTIVYLMSSRIKKDFVPLSPQNMRGGLRDQYPSLSSWPPQTHMCPYAHPHTNIHTYKALWICGFVAIGTDIEELVEKVKRCWKWTLFCWWHLTPSVSCQLSKRREGRV